MDIEFKPSDIKKFIEYFDDEANLSAVHEMLAIYGPAIATLANKTADRPLFMQSISMAHAGYADLLLKIWDGDMKGNENSKAIINEWFPDGYNWHCALHHAIESPSPKKMIEYVLQHGADVNQSIYKDNLPLETAIYKGSIEAVKTLIEQGADVHVKLRREGTMLHRAVRCGDNRCEVMNILLDQKPVIDAMDAFGVTPLMTAAHVDNVDICRILLSAGANIEATGKKGKTPLILAAERQNWAACEFLIDQNADVSHRDMAGKTAFDYAEPELLQVMKDARAVVVERKNKIAVNVFCSGTSRQINSSKLVCRKGQAKQ